MGKVFLFIILFSLWLLISGFFSPLFIFYGTVSSLISIYFYNKMVRAGKTEKSVYKVNYLSFGFLIYLIWLSKEIFISSIKVAVEMWREKPDVKPRLKWIKHSLKKDESVAIYANSITLTPGTISMYATKDDILVHALHKQGIEDLEEQHMHNRIMKSLEDHV